MATSLKRTRRLVDAYAFAGFRPQARVCGIFGDPHARIVTLIRRAKKQVAAPAGRFIEVGMTARRGGYGTCRAGMPGCISSWKSEEFSVGAAGQ